MGGVFNEKREYLSLEAELEVFDEVVKDI